MSNKFFIIIICIFCAFILYNVIDLFFVEKFTINWDFESEISLDTKSIITIPPIAEQLNDYFANIKLSAKQDEKKEMENIEMKDGYIVLYEKISGIIIKDKGNEIIIDGNFYKKGDIFKKMEIIEILPDRIYLKKDNKKYVIFFK
ncbi:MAG TPA: hypothetical protein PLD27_09925 [bacterium]|nr:hypothetical protein [bacterium]HOL48763.1 hypothetical protein [bacterium]HPQ19561.1 hypothetical protein [bacterium]